MERKVLDTLKEYSGIIHTLPILVRLHEDAMETYNTSKEKDSVSGYSMEEWCMYVCMCLSVCLCVHTCTCIIVRVCI